MAEATLFVSGSIPRTPPRILPCAAPALEAGRVTPAAAPEEGRLLVACGPPAEGIEVCIVDPRDSRLCPPQRVGEIWLRGENVVRGYWGWPEDDVNPFRARIAGDGEGGRCWYRTGDLGFMDEGELYITGRLKDLIIVDGCNHYPQDIEATVAACHPAFRGGGVVAFPFERQGREVLGVVAEVDRRGRASAEGMEEMLRRMQRAVTAEHDVGVAGGALVGLGAIPRTTSGKPRRKACAGGVLRGELEVYAGFGLSDPSASVPARSLDGGGGV